MPLEIITVLIAKFAGTAGYFFVSTVVRLNRFFKYLLSTEILQELMML
jgi:hypothetical protein